METTLCYVRALPAYGRVKAVLFSLHLQLALVSPNAIREHEPIAPGPTRLATISRFLAGTQYWKQSPTHEVCMRVTPSGARDLVTSGPRAVYKHSDE